MWQEEEAGSLGGFVEADSITDNTPSWGCFEHRECHGVVLTFMGLFLDPNIWSLGGLRRASWPNRGKAK